MLTQTSELAIRALIYIALQEEEKPTAPRQIAGPLGCSPTYLAKTFSLLVRAGILQSVRGASGGVLLARDVRRITLLEIFQACQGILIGNYCSGFPVKTPHLPCSYHRAMVELHQVTVATLAKWTLHDLLETPARSPDESGHTCRMFFEGCEQKCLKSMRKTNSS